MFRFQEDDRENGMISGRISIKNFRVPTLRAHFALPRQSISGCSRCLKSVDGLDAVSAQLKVKKPARKRGGEQKDFHGR